MSRVVGGAQRTARLRSELEAAELDWLLVSEASNLRYLTGYRGSNGLALIGRQQQLFVTDFRYVEQAAEEVEAGYERVHAPRELIRAVAERLTDGAAVRLGFDDAHVSVRGHRRLRELMPADVELVQSAGMVEALRRVKEPEELERIAAAARLADQALEQLLGDGLIGRTERELALALEVGMRERGAETVAFPSIVAAASHGALPHAEPRDARVGAGQLVVLDWGARIDGYCSDCTRTVATGELEGEAAEVYALVLEAQRAGLEAIRAGVEAAQVDRQAREVIGGAGYGEYFGHGLGHGVGLQTHEAPGLGARSRDTLEAGNVVTVEPGIYLPGRFGVRIEDLVVVRHDGYEVLTGLGKGLQVVS